VAKMMVFIAEQNKNIPQN